MINGRIFPRLGHVRPVFLGKFPKLLLDSLRQFQSITGKFCRVFFTPEFKFTVFGIPHDIFHNISKALVPVVYFTEPSFAFYARG